MRPFARLRSATGRVYSNAAEFIVGIATSRDGEAGQGEERRKQPRRRRRQRAGIRRLGEFHADTPDNHLRHPKFVAIREDRNAAEVTPESS